MQKLSIPFFVAKAGITIQDISTQLDDIERHSLEYLLWVKPQTAPQTGFAIAYDDDYIYLKFYVDEPHVKAEHRGINSPVYLDSCVEFFVSFGDDTAYYNLEFNCLGTCLGQFGPGKSSRTFLPAGILEKIETHSYFKNSDIDGLYYWELAIKISKKVFIHHNLNYAMPGRLRLNFYKCGDDLPEQHYLAWNKLQSAEPNFHLPEFFGEGYLEPHLIDTHTR